MIVVTVQAPIDILQCDTDTIDSYGYNFRRQSLQDMQNTYETNVADNVIVMTIVTV